MTVQQRTQSIRSNLRKLTSSFSDEQQRCRWPGKVGLQKQCCFTDDDSRPTRKGEEKRESSQLGVRKAGGRSNAEHRTVVSLRSTRVVVISCHRLSSVLQHSSSECEIFVGLLLHAGRVNAVNARVRPRQLELKSSSTVVRRATSIATRGTASRPLRVKWVLARPTAGLLRRGARHCETRGSGGRGGGGGGGEGEERGASRSRKKSLTEWNLKSRRECRDEDKRGRDGRRKRKRALSSARIASCCPCHDTNLSVLSPQSNWSHRPRGLRSQPQAQPQPKPQSRHDRRSLIDVRPSVSSDLSIEGGRRRARGRPAREAGIGPFDRARDAIPAVAVVVALVVPVVTVAVGFTLKICGSEKRTAEHHRPWQSRSSAADSRLRRGGREEEEDETRLGGPRDRGPRPRGVIIARQPTDERSTEENGGPRGGAGRCQLPDGHGEEQVHAGSPYALLTATRFPAALRAVRYGVEEEEEEEEEEEAAAAVVRLSVHPSIPSVYPHVRRRTSPRINNVYKQNAAVDHSGPDARASDRSRRRNVKILALQCPIYRTDTRDLGNGKSDSRARRRIDPRCTSEVD
ncbi:hypothetical protein DBV15_01353 [Temnothorax longispinosus]|uniref:Uncharacterized protein n=1 Tax=Temnothorax longispinosus TaxID=300112 RepID=A0A4S2L523_9HYME|nr:hypothetical protein DBV15_01353 [Temnothorax longispinosus]